MGAVEVSELLASTSIGWGFGALKGLELVICPPRKGFPVVKALST